MKTKHSSLWLFFCLLTVSDGSQITVAGLEGQSVTLPCTYDGKYHGPVPVCWGRSTLPNSGCNSIIIETDGTMVISRASDRYQILRMGLGDVSLTIQKATEKDSGLYGCRVQIPGWFNDIKTHVTLNIEKAFDQATSNTLDHATATPPTYSNHTPGHLNVNSTEFWDTSKPYYSQAESEQQSGQHIPVILICVLLTLLALVVVGLVVRRTWKGLSKAQQIPMRSFSLMHGRPSVSSLAQSRVVVENIYQIEGEDDYEDCP